MAENWMLYGAYGYTGKLLAREAVKRGHRPVLAGRSAEALRTLAEELDLPWIAVRLDDPDRLGKALQGKAAVLHAAGPFRFTSDRMIQACLEAGAHYLDITGEISVFQNTFSYHAEAEQAGVALISGCGFDVVPTDCLSLYVARQVPEANSLEIAFTSQTTLSAGTAQSSIEMLPRGAMRRVSGELVPVRLGSLSKKVAFSDHPRTVLAISWGDLETAYRSTGIPNITTYAGYSRRQRRMVRWLGPPAQIALRLKPLRYVARHLAEALIDGPSDEMRQKGRSYVWARAAAPNGQEAQAWLETIEAYQFTGVVGVRCVEKLLEGGIRGSLTPAQAFGPDFVLEIEGTRRFDRLEEKRS